MTPNRISCAVEARDQRDLSLIDSENDALSDLEELAADQIQFIDVLEELSEIDEAIFMDRLTRHKPTAAKDIHEMFKAATARAISRLVERLAKESH